MSANSASQPSSQPTLDPVEGTSNYDDLQGKINALLTHIKDEREKRTLETARELVSLAQSLPTLTSDQKEKLGYYQNRVEALTLFQEKKGGIDFEGISSDDTEPLLRNGFVDAYTQLPVLDRKIKPEHISRFREAMPNLFFMALSEAHSSGGVFKAIVVSEVSKCLEAASFKNWALSVGLASKNESGQIQWADQLFEKQEATEEERERARMLEAIPKLITAIRAFPNTQNGWSLREADQTLLGKIESKNLQTLADAELKDYDQKLTAMRDYYSGMQKRYTDILGRAPTLAGNPSITAEDKKSLEEIKVGSKDALLAHNESGLKEWESKFTALEKKYQVVPTKESTEKGLFALILGGFLSADIIDRLAEFIRPFFGEKTYGVIADALALAANQKMVTDSEILGQFGVVSDSSGKYGKNVEYIKLLSMTPEDMLKTHFAVTEDHLIEDLKNPQMTLKFYLDTMGADVSSYAGVLSRLTTFLQPLVSEMNPSELGQSLFTFLESRKAKVALAASQRAGGGAATGTGGNPPSDGDADSGTEGSGTDSTDSAGD